MRISEQDTLWEEVADQVHQIKNLPDLVDVHITKNNYEGELCNYSDIHINTETLWVEREFGGSTILLRKKDLRNLQESDEVYTTIKDILSKLFIFKVSLDNLLSKEKIDFLTR